MSQGQLHRVSKGKFPGAAGRVRSVNAPAIPPLLATGISRAAEVCLPMSQVEALEIAGLKYSKKERRCFIPGHI